MTILSLRKISFYISGQYRAEVVMLLFVQLISLWSSYREAVRSLYIALENGSNLHVNKRQKIRHYRGRSTGK